MKIGCKTLVARPSGSISSRILRWTVSAATVFGVVLPLPAQETAVVKAPATKAPVSAEKTAEQAGPPRVENRVPLADEIGYRPADGSTTTFNPPSLTWLHQKEAHTYEVQWSTDKNFADAQTMRNLPFNVYTHNTTLKPGTYYWHYRFHTKDGTASDWSVTRSFTIGANAIAFPMPNREEQRARIPQAHPRLFMRPEDLPRLRELAKGKEAERFARLRAEADKLLATEPDPEPAVMASARDPKTREFWWPNRVAAQKVCMEAETLAFVYLMTGEQKYATGARKWIMHLASWDPAGSTNFKLNCEAAKPMLHRIPRAYDWAYDALSEDDRKIVRAVMKQRAEDAWVSGEVLRGTGHLNKPYNSHANRTFHKLGECAIAMLGDEPEATTWLDYALNKFYAAYPMWSDDDGGWHEGAAYWAGYNSKIVWWLQVMKSALNIDGMKKPFYKQVGDFVLYMAPPNSPNMGFGDLSAGKVSTGWGGFTEYFQRAAAAQPDPGHAAYWRWFSQQWKMSGDNTVLGFLYAANLGPLPEAKAPTDLPQSKIFHGIGVASLHSTLLDSNDDVHLLFKASPFGSQSHGFNAQNSFQLNAYGEDLLPAITYRDRYSSPFHDGWVRETKSQNDVLVNGKGQAKKRADIQGRIFAENLTPKFDYVAGDATECYAGSLKRFHRHIAFVKPDIIVIYDDLEATEPSNFQWMLHAHKAFEVDEANNRLVVERTKAGARIQYLSPQPLAFRQWDGYEPKPEKKFPNQWHVEAGTSEKQKTLGMLTVILPYRVGQAAEWKAERLESDGAIGVRLTRGGQNMRIGFRKFGKQGPVTLDGWSFDAAAAVQ